MSGFIEQTEDNWGPQMLIKAHRSLSVKVKRGTSALIKLIVCCVI